MKQKNYAFVDIVSNTFLLILLCSNFLALLYITKGNTVFSFIISFFITVLYYFTVAKMTENKEALVRQNYKHPAIIFIVFFTVLAFVSFIFMSHFLNIEFNAKPKIQEEAIQKIKLTSYFVDTYDKRSKTEIQDFEADLRTKLTNYKKYQSNVLRNKLENSPFNVSTTVLNSPSYIDVNQVTIATISPLHIKVEANKKYFNVNIAKNSEKFMKVFQNWQRLSIMTTYANLNNYVEESYNNVNEKIKLLPFDNTPIPNVGSSKLLPLDSPSKLTILYKPNYGFIGFVILIIHLGILLPYILGKIRRTLKTDFSLSEQAKKLVREIE
ncbi:hypothetical protein [Flavobacterium facile]|uniref:hypothetical protein n=1 Tax=Flavobacterium facile TaxID=2893174 RepID=UPI002E776AE9|nr:hypothetical protein [Flavobacterium sp. T-12]